MADEQSKANGTVQDPESGLGTQDIDSNNIQSNGGADSNDTAQSNQSPQVEDIGPDNEDSNDSNDDDNLVVSKKAYKALLKERAQFEALKNQLKNEATAQISQINNSNDLVNNSLNNNTDNDNGTLGTNDNVQCTSNARHGTLQQLPQVNIDTSVRPRTYADVVSTPSQNNSQNNFTNSQANIAMRSNATFIQPTVLSQQPIQSIPTQTFYSQVPQVQQTYNMPPTNFNQNLNATPIYFVDRPKPPEIPYFKHNTLEQFNKYLVNFENQCSKNYPDDREQWRTMLINKMSREIKATLPPEAEYDWSYEKVLCNIQDYLKLNDDQVERSPMSDFWRLTKLHNETPKAFSVKLLRLFKEAHPQKEFDYEYDNILIERFVDAQAEDTRNHIKENTLISKATGQRIAYEAYVKLAEQFENNKRKRQQNYEKAQQNVSQPKYYPNQFKNVNQNKVCQNNELDNSYDNDCQLLQGFETTNFTVPSPNYNHNPQAKLCQTYEQQINWEGNNSNIIQGLESVNFSVPPPSCNFMSNGNNINPSVNEGHVGYAGVGSNPDYGSVPNQPIQAQQSTKPKDNTPYKNTPPGVCNYCEKRGHGRQTCRLLKAREQEPHLTWCNICLMKNHKDIHCTYKVNITPSISSNNYNKNSSKSLTQQVKYVQYPPKLNTFEYNKIRVFTNSKFHSQKYNVKKEITKRLSQLSPELRTKVLNTYTSKSPKNNFIICPHYKVQNNKNCHFCKNSHPELLKLEKVIASYNNNFIAPSTVPTINKSSTSTVPNNVQPQLNINNNSVPKEQIIINSNVKSKLNKKSKLNSKVKVKKGKEVKERKQTDLEKFSNNNQNSKNHAKLANNVSLKPKKPLPDKAPTVIEDLEAKCNVPWTKDLDKAGDQQESKISTVIYQGQVKSREVHNNNSFDAGSSIRINSLHAPYPSSYGITNTPRRIKITNESFNTDTTVRNVKTNYFWVNLNNHFIYSLVDSGADCSSVRKDIVDKFKIDIVPLADDESKCSKSLTGLIPTLGTVWLNIKLADVDLKLHKFKVVPKLNDDTDELVLGHDFLVSKELTFCGDRRLLRGFYKEGIIWTFQSEESKMTRILSDISCFSKSALKVKPKSTVEIPVRVDLPSHLVDDNANYVIKNFSYATFLNLIRPLNIEDLPYDDSPKYQLRYYTSYPDNFYIVNLKEPIMELENQTKKELSYKDNSLIGKAYNIFTIFMDRVNVEDQYQNKYLTIKDKGNYIVEPHVRECFIKTNVEVGSSLNGTTTIKINSINDSGFHESLTTVPNDTGTDFSNSSLNDGNYFTQELKIILDDDLINKDHINNDDPLLSDFNPPDEYDLKDPSEWTKESLNDSVKTLFRTRLP
ncbi:unnamed protein product [Rotaria socialis]|uniref:Uncharacterized protein n=1 Tax=Rotaria socialis TaxID=392032 RepID=A0A821LRT0_9BILA|nr:unnamed protein product [Rotaria socialis]